jgi:hypothetical protein
MMTKHTILGVHITDRLKEAQEVQKLLTTYGTHIKTRLGLHEVANVGPGPNGLLLLEMEGPESAVKALTDKLTALAGVEVKSMVFEHPAP